MLSTTRLKFDVISTDVTNLQYKQNASLYTKEYFEIMKSKLTDNGVACAWIPLTGLSEFDLKVLIKTFMSIYPNTSIWIDLFHWTNFAILIGTNSSNTITLQQISKIFTKEKVKTDLEKINIYNAEHLMSTAVLDEKGLIEYVGEVPLHTDKHPILEYSSSPTIFRDDIDIQNIFETLYSIAQTSPPAFITQAIKESSYFSKIYTNYLFQAKANRHQYYAGRTTGITQQNHLFRAKENYLKVDHSLWKPIINTKNQQSN